jgi:hypothetical protein
MQIEVERKGAGLKFDKLGMGHRAQSFTSKKNPIA